MSVFCITSQGSIGCTFLDWSIHFLSGQEQFYRCDVGQWEPLSSNPVQSINAHGHPKNHPGGAITTHQCIQQLLAQPKDKLYSLYPTSLRATVVAKQLNIPIESVGQHDNFQQITKKRSEELSEIFKICRQENVKIIYVNTDPYAALYFLNIRFLDVGFFRDTPLESAADAKNDLMQALFKHSINSWQEQGLTNIWDERERQALDLRPLKLNFTDPEELLQHPHLWINSMEIWNSGELAVLKMLQYLELEVDPDRLAAWRPIYAKWQDIQQQNLNFCYQYQHVVDSIVNNWYYEIDLTFDQEVVIQHCLIYQHNLNLKTWQLTKFPNNTQDLHKLLETNIHKLTD
jgi:hypothetical protein